MSSIHDLKLKNETFAEAGQSYDELPDQFGPSRPPFPVGDYRWQLPKKFDWESMDTTDYGQRVNCVFGAANPLIVVQSKGGALDGEPFETRMSNAPRKRNAEGTIIASDLDYLLKSLGETTRPKNNLETVKMVEAHAGDQFAASIEWSYRCAKGRERYISDGQGGSVPDPEKKEGCGARYYQSQVAGPGQEPPLRIECSQCGAIIRAFANLTRIRA